MVDERFVAGTPETPTGNKAMQTLVHYSGHGNNRTFIAADLQEDPSKFSEGHVLTSGMREEMDAFYDRIDIDLALDERGGW